jgi:N-acylneuraminate cytidylyltransferase
LTESLRDSAKNLIRYGEMSMTAITGRYVALIPARGGSRGIPLKNIAPIGGKPLVYWVTSACSASRHLSEVFISTESEEIRRCVAGMDLPRVRIIGRSSQTASDDASTESAFLEFAEAHSFDHAVLVQATSPLLTSREIDAAIEKYASSGADSLLSVVRTKRFIWTEAGDRAQPANYNPVKRPRRQDWRGQLVENGALYLTSRERLLTSGCRMSGDIAVYEMAPETIVELDESWEWDVIDSLLRLRGRSEQQFAARAAKLKLFCVDVDGTLTDGGMYYNQDGELLKRFDTRDAMGMDRLRKNGLILALLTAEDSRIARSRAAKLKIDEIHVGVNDKERCMDKILNRLGLGWDELGYVGDDLNDLGIIRRAGFSACPSDAAPEVAQAALYVCNKAGGAGAVREVCDMLLAIRNITAP